LKELPGSETRKAKAFVDLGNCLRVVGGCEPSEFHGDWLVACDGELKGRPIDVVSNVDGGFKAIVDFGIFAGMDGKAVEPFGGEQDHYRHRRTLWP
jgi:hypothetical protein